MDVYADKTVISLDVTQSQSRVSFNEVLIIIFVCSSYNWYQNWLCQCPDNDRTMLTQIGDKGIV